MCFATPPQPLKPGYGPGCVYLSTNPERKIASNPAFFYLLALVVIDFKARSWRRYM